MSTSADLIINSPHGTIRVEVTGETVVVSVNGVERVGASVADPDRGDPTIVLWDETGEAIFTIHPTKETT